MLLHMDAAAAALGGAALGIVGAWGAALIAGRSQRRLALLERRRDAYVAVLLAQHRAEHMMRRATNLLSNLLDRTTTGGRFEGLQVDLEALADAILQARAVGFMGSKEVRNRIEAVYAAIGAWAGDNGLMDAILSQLDHKDASIEDARPGLEILRALITQRLALVQAAIRSLEDQMNSELT